MIKYNVHFKTSNGIKYSLSVNGGTKLKKLLITFERHINVFKDLTYIYNGQEIEFNSSLFITDLFKNEQNPTIFVEDKEKLIGKLINVTFKLENGDEFLFIFNSKSKINVIKDNFFFGILFEPNYNDKDQIKFLYNNHNINFDDITIIEDFFKNDDNPKIFINDPNNLIGKKIKVTFKINNAYTKEIITITEKTIGNLLKTFLGEIDENFDIYSSYLFSEYEKWTWIKKFIMQIKFLYKGKQINWLNDDQKNYKISYNITSIGDYFENDNNPVIFVMDMNNFLSSINVTFKTTYGHCFNLTISSTRTLDHLLTKYVYEMKHFELVDTYKIAFFYYNKQIIFGDNTTLNEVFLNDNNPLIAVVDANYLLYNNLLNKVNLYFTRCDGREDYLAVNYGSTVEQAIKMYLYKLGEEE